MHWPHKGITLLELAIVLAVLGVIFFIALPTLQPTPEEAAIEAVKANLTYLHDKQQQYFKLHGQFAPLKVLAADPEVGKDFDKRFAADQPVIDGVQYLGPQMEGFTFEVLAILPEESGRYKVDQTGKVISLQ
jgi:prepilin-type N-terminal cleavage/methylation domain-containing protein